MIQNGIPYSVGLVTRDKDKHHKCKRDNALTERWLFHAEGDEVKSLA